MIRHVVAALMLTFAAPTLAGEDFHVDPEVGNSNFNAIFDAKLGERINAISSDVLCNATYDEKSNAFSGSCAVPLTSIRVDNNETKSEHFHEWATNGKSNAKDCKLEAKFDKVKLGAPLVPNQPVSFSAEIPFTVCGRGRADKGKEKVTGAVVLFPAGTYGSAKIFKVRARIDSFSREKYQIGPKWTSGWLSRVQALASVVADEGSIDLSLFARAKEAPKAQESK